MDELNDIDPDLLFNDDSDPFDIPTETTNAQIPKATAIPDSLDALLADDDDYDDFPDFDADELVKAAESAERQRQPQTITFEQTVQQDVLQDPIPPAPLAPHTANFHKFDNQKLCTWVYPINYPTRNYQLNMVKKGLFQNTLIALPTGLGKTFIAAVIMFNYWRWFPESKVIFLAPTRPLVAQQIEACFKICGLPQSDTIEMTGQMPVPKRTEHWRTKRVFFMTPQTMQNDLATRICPAEKIACLVVDEAHKATGNYAFSEVVRLISKSHPHFRVLALTATPGSNLDNVQTVVNNLHINNIQIRTEESMDIQEYTHGKQIQRIVVRLSYVEGATGVLPRAINTFHTQVFVPKLKELLKFNAIQTDDPSKNAPFSLMQARQRFRENARNMTNFIRNKVTMAFMTCEALSRANDLLCNHGIAPFIDSIEGITKQARDNMEEGKGVIPSDRAIMSHPELGRLISTLKREMNMPGFIGHPKMERLVNILLDHFANSDEHSKVMIFSSFRNSVDEICRALSVHDPMIRCSEFVGQASGKTGTKGLKQAEQQKIITRFKNDELNTLVCTSIGEEGLDIGEVDLIVCYDSQSSPIRMLQRMGRTGRKRKGRCILLLTEAEDKKYSTAKETYAKVQQFIARGNTIKYHHFIPSVIPANYKPTMSRQKLTIGAYIPIVKNKRGVKVEEQDYTTDGKMKEQTLNAFIKSFPNSGLTSLDALMNHYWPIVPFKSRLNAMIPIQKSLQPTHRVPHSKTTKYFSACIRRMEHRILHPGQDIPAPKVVRQKKLIMPRRQKPTLEEPLPKKQKVTLEDHFEDYLNHVDMSFLDEPGPSRPRRDSIDELIKDVRLNEPGPSRPRHDSIDELIKDVRLDDPKKKHIDEIDELIKDVRLDETSIDIKGKRRAVEPILNPRKKTKTMDNSIEMSVEKSLDMTSAKDDDKFEQQRSWSSMLPASPPAIINKDSPLKDVPRNLTQEFDDFGDDDMFNDAAALEKFDDMADFQEDLPPIYPFEKPPPDAVEIKCIFPQRAPTFSDKSLALLKQKYQSLRGDTMLVKIIAQLISKEDSEYSFGDNDDFEEMLKEVDIITAKKSEPIMIEDSQSQPIEKQQPKDDDVFADEDSRSQPIEKQQPKDDDMFADEDSQPVIESQPTEKQQSATEEKQDDMFGDDDEIAFDFDDELLANMIENKGVEGAEEISLFLESQFQKTFGAQESQKPPLSSKARLDDGVNHKELENRDAVQQDSPINSIKEEKEEIMIFSSFGDSQQLDKTVLMSKPEEPSGLFVTEGPISVEPEEVVFDMMDSQLSQVTKPDDFSSSPIIHAKKKKGRILMDDSIDSPEEKPMKRVIIQKTGSDDFEDGPFITPKKKGRILMDEEDSIDSPEQKPMKRVIIQKAGNDDEDFEDGPFIIPKKHSKNHLKKQQPSKTPNPFIEMEAERSEDDISEDEEEGMDEDAFDDSFINDDVSFMTQGHRPQQDVSPVQQRWMRGFHADKWLQPQEDDTIIDDDDEEEEEEEEEEVEEESGSLILANAVVDDDDDDFM